MRKIKTYMECLLTITIMSLLITIIFIPTIQSDNHQSRGTIYVDDDADPGWYDATHVHTIQEGIDNASHGDTVFVHNGTYTENIIVNTAISLTGKAKNNTIIDGGGHGDVVYVSSDWVNISGFTLKNSGDFWSHPEYDGGLELNDVTNCSISGMRIINTTVGILLMGSHNNTIQNNVVTTNHFGLRLYNHSDNNTIDSNVIISCVDEGIFLDFSNYNSLKNNTVSNNSQGILFEDTQNNTIHNGDINNNGVGIALDGAEYNEITLTNITSNDKGVYLHYANWTSVSMNTISLNEEEGLKSNRSFNNSIFLNNFISNTLQANDSGVNKWYHIIGQQGNYWDNYNGTDANHDGIGDTPYNITDGSNQDLYPLMEPWAPGNISPAASFTWSTDGCNVSFNDTSTDVDGMIFSWEWDFGDGQSSILQHPIHTYDAPGYYLVTLSVKDNEMLMDTTSHFIHIVKEGGILLDVTHATHPHDVGSYRYFYSDINFLTLSFIDVYEETTIENINGSFELTFNVSGNISVLGFLIHYDGPAGRLSAHIGHPNGTSTFVFSDTIYDQNQWQFHIHNASTGSWNIQLYTNHVANISFLIGACKEPMNASLFNTSEFMILCSPYQSYSSDEITHMNDYLSTGGRILVSGESNHSVWGRNLNGFICPLGIELSDELHDPTNNSGESYRPIIHTFSDHPVALKAKELGVSAIYTAACGAVSLSNPYAEAIATSDNDSYAVPTFPAGSYPPFAAGLIYDKGRIVVQGDSTPSPHEWYQAIASWLQAKNLPPEISDEYPTHTSVNVSRPPEELNVTIGDDNGDNMTITMRWLNHTPEQKRWEILANWSHISNGSYAFTPLNTTKWIWGNTTYIWSVNVTDGTFWVNKTFSFTTGGSRYDVDNDGNVGYVDALTVWAHRNGNPDDSAYDGLYDVNDDDQIDYFDALLVWSHRDG